ncbi:MAG: MBL fold metallo-hydrolase [Clostridia bacterium]
MKVRFCGAARAVTGSCHLISFDGGNILVDCGMRQGADTKGEYGEDQFPFEPKDISAVMLTHAHIDHSGLIPLLTKRGFTGNVFTTEATAELASIMLPDSGHIQQQEAEYQNRKNTRAGKSLVEPMYTVEDANDALKHFRSCSYNEPIQVIDGVKARFADAGHLLGSASIELWIEEKGVTTKVVFSGDIGRDDRPIICDPQSIDGADYLVMEGTYGDRNHEVSTTRAKEDQLAKILKAAIIRGGNIVIPSFAVGRTQELLFYIKKMLLNGAVPGLERVPVYIDSPLGISATKIYEHCAKGYYDEETRRIAAGGSPFEFESLRVAQTADESKLINSQQGSNIIISSSGMCDAGRIRHHLKHNLYRADSTIVFVGYQAEGTLGRMLLDGAKKVRLFGEDVRVNATIERIEGFSGHAGRDELIEWVGNIKQKPSHIFLVHGESSVLDSLKQAISSLGYEVNIPELGQEYDMVANAMRPQPLAPVTKPTHMREETDTLRIRAQAQRIADMLEAVSSGDETTRLKLSIMELDITQFVDKWEKLLK